MAKSLVSFIHFQRYLQALSLLKNSPLQLTGTQEFHKNYDCHATFQLIILHTF